jgi:hypothetical protein
MARCGWIPARAFHQVRWLPKFPQVCLLGSGACKSGKEGQFEKEVYGQVRLNVHARAFHPESRALRGLHGCMNFFGSVCSAVLLASKAGNEGQSEKEGHGQVRAGGHA